MSDKFWKDDPSILYRDNRFIEFFPTKDQTNKERLNALSRLAIYSCISIAFKTQSFTPIVILGIILVALTLVDSENSLVEDYFSGQPPCTMPTKDNPFMNVQLSDYYFDPNRPPACDITDEHVKDEIEDKFNFNLYKNVSDVFNKYNSQREFVTNPSTTIPNDREKFSNFLFGELKSCKDNPFHCEPFEPVSKKRKPVFLS